MQTSLPPARPDVAEADGLVIENTRMHIILAVVLAVVPLALVIYAGVLAWQKSLHWQDLVVLAVCYVPVGLGVTVGWHRLFTHRSFKTGPVLRGILGALGSASVEGPMTHWVAVHRKHHAFADEAGDPHSPHVDHEGGVLGSLRGLVHAHIGWLFLHTQRPTMQRYAPDLVDDPVASFVTRWTLLWIAIGLLVPFGLGLALTGSVAGGLTGLLWGGAVRIFLLHHVTYSINSLCHVFGRRRFATDDESRNLAWLAPLSFGEAWHNNHHAFPTSAAHGLGGRELDLSALVIGGFERLGWAWDVVRISPERQRRKAQAGPSAHADG